MAEQARLTVSSSSFQGKIPVKYTGDGSDLSPALQWSGAPTGTKEYVVICDDPDAPTPRPWVHWVLYGIAPATTALAEGASVGRSGLNSWGGEGYRGPAPPHGKPHRYFFKVYAVDAVLGIAAGAEKDVVERAMRGHIVGEGEIVGTYQR